MQVFFLRSQDYGVLYRALAYSRNQQFGPQPAPSSCAQPQHSKLLVLLLSLPLFFAALLYLSPPAFAQGNDAFEDGLDWVSEPMKQDVKERVEQTLKKDYPRYEQEVRPRLRQFMQENSRVDRYVAGNHPRARRLKSQQTRYENMPARHPMLGDPSRVGKSGVKEQFNSEDTDNLGRGVNQPGIADSSEGDYTDKDSRVIFNTKTFANCFEERQVMDGPYFEECKQRCPMGWVTYTGSRATSCIPCLEDCGPFDVCIPCKYNQFYVSEYYWPTYISRTYPGRAIGSFNPYGDYLHDDDKPTGETNGQQLAYEYSRDTIYDRFVGGGEDGGEGYLKEYYEEVHGDQDRDSDDFQEAFPEEYFYAFDYTGRDLNTTDGIRDAETHSNHTLVYMSNANRQLSRRTRPDTDDNWKGFVMEHKCFANTLPDSTKLAVSHASYNEGHDEVTLQYKHREISEPAGVQNRGSAWDHAMLGDRADAPNIYDIARKLDQEFPGGSTTQPENSLMRMWGQFIEMNSNYYRDGFEREGVELRTHWQDWLYHNFFRLYHSRNKNLMEDPLYAKIVAGFSFYTLNSLPTFGPNLSNDGERRPYLWSFSAGRGNSGSNPRDGENYAGPNQPVGPGKIFSVDKIQVIYPTLDDGNLGSECFKPESLAKGAYFDPDKDRLDDQIGTQGFWGFRRDLYKRLLEEDVKDVHNYVREVRLAYWTKRVNCHCTICSREFLGCSILNNGDNPDDYFYGTREIETQEPIFTPEVELKKPDSKLFKAPIAPIPAPSASLSPKQELNVKPSEVKDDSLLKTVSLTPDKNSSLSAKSETTRRYPSNRLVRGDYSVSPFDNEAPTWGLQRVADTKVLPDPWPRTRGYRVNTKVRSGKPLNAKQQRLLRAQEELPGFSGQYDPNARNVYLSQEGKKALDKNAVEPKDQKTDKFSIGLADDVGTPGPINNEARDYLQNSLEEDEPGDPGSVPPDFIVNIKEPPPKAPLIEFLICPITPTNCGG